MTPLNAQLVAELVDLLKPLAKNERQRRSLLTLALPSDPIIDAIDYSGSTQEFVPNLVAQLSDHGEVEPGKQAVWVVLEVAHGMAGLDKQRRIDVLEPVVNAPPQTDDALQALNVRFEKATMVMLLALARTSSFGG